jgi:hypothetical protein
MLITLSLQIQIHTALIIAKVAAVTRDQTCFNKLVAVENFILDKTVDKIITDVTVVDKDKIIELNSDR